LKVTAATPVVYLLHGDDEFAITRQIDELIARMGDASLAAMNVTRLDGRSADLEELLSIASTMPFLARRRVVILEYPLACLERTSDVEWRQSTLNRMAGLPETTALVLVEKRPLTDDRDRKKGKIHWLEAWAAAAGSQVWGRQFSQPKGVLLGQWIQARARDLGGQFDLPAANALAGLVGGDSRRAEQEIEKLMAYVDYRRPVHIDDVRLLTADTSEMSIFDLVDAIGTRDEKLAFTLLQKLQEQEDSVYIFSMVIRQFRLLLLARDLLERNTPETEVARLLGVHPFVAGKVSRQARQFTLPTLEVIYHHLLEIDLAIKTSQMTGELALDTLLASLAFTPR
jgi:DNA polymerase-3 subunit delta